MPTTDEVEVAALSDEYERHLLAHDIDAMDAVFWDSPEVLRFGVAEMQVGFDAVRAWRRSAVPVPSNRRTVSRHVLELAPGVVAVDLVFRNGDEPKLGRQSQTWVRRPEGWRIVRAHVSVI